MPPSPRPRLGLLLLACAFSSTLAACGEATDPVDAPDDTGDGSPGPASDPDAADLVCGLVQTVCERQLACGHPIVNGDADVAGCVATQRCDLVAEVAASPDIEVDPEALAACAEAVAAASCEVLASVGLSVDRACLRYLVGTRQEGEPCQGGAVSDCAPGLTCDLEEGTCPGTCRAPVEACSEGSCGDAAFCAADGACRPRAALGEACDASQLDFDNLRDDPCLAGAHCEEGVCVADLAAGSACLGEDVHACGVAGACRCDDPTTCTEDGMVCRGAVTAGDACLTTFDCGAGLYCDLDAGRCAPRAAAGEACSAHYGACAHPYACVDGRCGSEAELPPETRLLAAGDSCAGGGSCPLGTACACSGPKCEERVCAPAPRLGESCEDQLAAGLNPIACAEGLCDVYGSRTCVLPAAGGAPCASDGLTLACASLVCDAGRCASFEGTRCEER